jgi:zinc/manganese transport system substrate-binding protein
MGGMRRLLAVPLIAATAVMFAGCSTATNGRTANGTLKVVAGENFWGDLARQIGGNHIAVTSLISSPDADPHLFEAGTSNGLAVATAAVVIVNGASYDSFMDRLLAAAASSDRTVVRISDVLQISGNDPNPHLWYDTPRLPTERNGPSRRCSRWNVP